MASIVEIGVAAALVVGAGYALLHRGGDTPPADAHRLVAEGALLLDVRTPEEFDEAHIDGAVNIPLSEIERRIAELGSKSRPVVLYCRSGNRSGQAARILARAGFEQIHDLGAMSSW